MHYTEPRVSGERRGDRRRTADADSPPSRRRHEQVLSATRLPLDNRDRHGSESNYHTCSCRRRFRRSYLTTLAGADAANALPPVRAGVTVGIAGARPSSLSTADRVSGERRRRMQLDNGTSRHARSPLTRPASRITSARAHGDSGTVSFAGARPSSLSAADRSRLHEQVHRRRVRHTPAPTMHLFVQAIRSAADRLVDTTDNVSVELQITTCLGSKR